MDFKKNNNQQLATIVLKEVPLSDANFLREKAKMFITAGSMPGSDYARLMRLAAQLESGEVKKGNLKPIEEAFFEAVKFGHPFTVEFLFEKMKDDDVLPDKLTVGRLKQAVAVDSRFTEMPGGMWRVCKHGEDPVRFTVRTGAISSVNKEGTGNPDSGEGATS